MKSLLRTTIAVVALAALSAMAADTTQGGMGSMPTNMQHEGRDMNSMQHGAMNMGGMVQLGEVTVDGVQAQGHIMDVRAEMAKNKQPFTHHLMLMFKDTSGKAVLKGRSAVKVTGPDGKTGEAVTMMADATHFGADLTLPAPGTYTFTVGTKFEDGKTRQFVFTFLLK